MVGEGRIRIVVLCSVMQSNLSQRDQTEYWHGLAICLWVDTLLKGQIHEWIASSFYVAQPFSIGKDAACLGYWDPPKRKLFSCDCTFRGERGWVVNCVGVGQCGSGR